MGSGSWEMTWRLQLINLGIRFHHPRAFCTLIQAMACRLVSSYQNTTIGTFCFTTINSNSKQNGTKVFYIGRDFSQLAERLRDHIKETNQLNFFNIVLFAYITIRKETSRPSRSVGLLRILSMMTVIIVQGIRARVVQKREWLNIEYALNHSVSKDLFDQAGPERICNPSCVLYGMKIHFISRIRVPSLMPCMAEKEFDKLSVARADAMDTMAQASTSWREERALAVQRVTSLQDKLSHEKEKVERAVRGFFRKSKWRLE